jgi:hypothetical protein
VPGKIYKHCQAHSTRERPGRGIIEVGVFGGRTKRYATFWTLPERMHEVQTRSRRPAPFTKARTGCKFTFHRRFVTLCA